MNSAPKHNLPNVFNSIVDTIGNTPLIKLKTFRKFKGNYYAKVEAFNPGRSSKDRIGISIIEEAEKKGLLNSDSTIIEATSGNTGLGLALVAIQKGYKVILVMPDKMSPEKMNLVKALGCEVIVCPTEVRPDDPKSYYSVSQKLVKEIPNSFYANQYHNEANPLAHYQTTGPEIWEQTEGKVTHFIAGVGTGGTISGTAKYLKEKNKDIKIIGVDPVGSILAYYHKYRTTEGIEAQTYKVEGVGEDIIPTNVYFDLIDDFVIINDKESFEWTRKIAKEEGILVGPSSGMVLAGTEKYADNIINGDACVVILLPDTGERYLGRVFSDSWMRANGFLPPVNTINEILQSKSANLPPLIYLKPENTINDAFNKVQKFDIEIILIEDVKDEYKYITKTTLYDLILSGIDIETKLNDLNLVSINSILVNTEISELKKLIIENNYLLVKKDDEIIGIITKEDVIQNIRF